MLKKTPIKVLSLLIALVAIFTSCNIENSPVAQSQLEKENETEFSIQGKDENSNLIVRSSQEDMDLFHDEFESMAKRANSEVKMSSELLESGLYVVSFSGDLTDIVEINEVVISQETRGKKWYHFTVIDRYNVRHCWSTKKRTKFGAGVWYAHAMPPCAMSVGGGTVSGLKKGGC